MTPKIHSHGPRTFSFVQARHVQQVLALGDTFTGTTQAVACLGSPLLLLLLQGLTESPSALGILRTVLCPVDWTYISESHHHTAVAFCNPAFLLEL